jgi:hypothetical protein
MVAGMARRRPNRRSAAPVVAVPEPATARRVRWAAASGVGLVAFVVYLLTAARDIIPGDTPEFITVALTGGVAHPPGYPLLSLLGVVFGQLPVGPLPLRIDLISVLCHAGTVALVFLTAERLTRNVAASAAGALVFAFGKTFWTWSLVAETFPLNDLLAALALYCLVLWHGRPERAAPLYGAAAAFGLGFANQQTITLLLPAAAYVAYAQRRALRRPVVIRAAGILVACAVVPYAYIAMAAGRHAVLNWGGIAGPGDVLRQILRLDYGTGQLLPSRTFQGGTGIDRIVEFAKYLNPVSAALAVLGAVRAYRRARWYFWTVVLAFAISGPLFLGYANANLAIETARLILLRFFLLPQVVIAPLTALGLVFIAELLGRRLPERRPWLGRAVAGAALAVAALEIGLTYGAVDRSNDHVARQFAEDILATTPQNGIILANGDHVVLPLLYLHTVEGARPDVTIIVFPLLAADWYQREVKLRHPELELPLARYDQPDGLLTIVRANPKRSFFLTSEEPDQTFAGEYGLYPRGLTLPIVSTKQTLDLNEIAKDNEQLLASYRIPRPDAIDRDSHERFIVTWYALVPYRVAVQYENAKHPAEARPWYERVLAIDPQLPEASAALRRINARQ